MKQFNLEEYNKLISEGKTPKIVTRDERNVVILDSHYKGEYGYCVIAKTIEDDYQVVRWYKSDGIWDCDNTPSCNDLFFTTEKKEGWRILKKKTVVYDTEEVAEINRKGFPNPDEWMVAHVTWEE